jgi:DNA-binding XRE family transcriptional regulator
MSAPRDFGTRLADLRVRAKLRQDTLAGHLKITRVAVVHLENGQSFPSFWTLLEIARFFDVDLNWLAGHQYTPHTERKAA